MDLSVIDRKGCAAYVPGVATPYGYVPSQGAGIAFCVLFGLSMLAHSYVSIRYRVWWQLVFPIGALCEVIGWIGRTISADCPYQTSPFIMQITTLILAPTFFTAGIYVILGAFIRSFGPEVSPLSPNMYLYIFCTIDTISLVVQAVGGGDAAVAFQKTPMGNTANGTHIMLAGILFQLVSLLAFCVLFTKVMIKAVRLRGDLFRLRRFQFVAGATVFSVLTVVIRSIYRSIELAQGWTGYLITHERYFIGLDGAMMVLAVGVFNIAQPRWSKIEGEKSADETEFTELETANTSVLDSK